MTLTNLDEIDRKILTELQSNGRISVVELSNRVNLTKTPCAERLRRLERNGIIEGYRAQLNPKALDASYISFVQISLEQTTTEMFEKFYEAVNRIPEIQSCHMVAGGIRLSSKDPDTGCNSLSGYSGGAHCNASRSSANSYLRGYGNGQGRIQYSVPKRS